MDSGLMANAAFRTNNDGHCSDRKATLGEHKRSQLHLVSGELSSKQPFVPYPKAGYGCCSFVTEHGPRESAGCWAR